MILDHLRRHPDERERVLVKAARVPAHVECADGAPERIGNRRARAGENPVRVQKMLVRVDDGRLSVDQRGADRIGAAIRFGPRHARTQRDAIGFFDEVAVAETVQDHAVIVGEQHHALRVDDLRVQRLHDRERMRIKRLIAIDELPQRGPAQRMKVRRFRRAQADLERARVSLREGIRPTEAGRRGGTMGQGMSPEIGRAAGALPAVRCRSATCARAAEYRSYRTKRAVRGSENTESMFIACRKKPRIAAKSRKPKGKLAQRPNSSKVNQFTSASRELQCRRNRG